MNLETRLFAYGTLKQGSPMHEQLCRGVRSVITARLWGRLFELPSGCPALLVPSEAVLGLATSAADEDHVRLAATQHVSPPAYSRDGWRPITGHLITFADFNTIWPTLDAWEDASPSAPQLFRRAIVRIERNNGVPITAWTYIVTQLPEHSRELVTGEWPVPEPLPAGE